MKVARAREEAFDLAVQYFVAARKKSDKAMAWLRGRGWTDETIDKAKIGFWDGDYKGLKNYLSLHDIDLKSPPAVALIGFKGDVAGWYKKYMPDDEPDDQWVIAGKIPAIIPAEMIIYPHLKMGRVKYISARKLEVEEGGVKSWNVRRQLAGPRQPYWNGVGERQKKRVIVVEGQADAITLRQWKLPAVALAGTHAPDDLVEDLRDYEQVFVALDGDDAGASAAAKVAARLTSSSRIVRLPAGQDVNDLLKGENMTADQFVEMLGQAHGWPLHLCHLANNAGVLEKSDLAKEAIASISKLNRYQQAPLIKEAAKLLNMTQAILKEQLKALNEEKKEREKKEKAAKPMCFSIGGYREDILYEMIHDTDENTTAFVVRDADGKISTQPMIEFSDYEVYPYPPNESLLVDRTLKLPSQPEEYGTTKELVEIIRTHINEFVDIPEEVENMVSYYVMLTWMADLLPVVPYLRAIGETGSGKTRFIQAAGSCCMRAVMASGKSSPAWMYRTIERYGIITLVLDEADYSKHDENSEVINILNTGNRKEGFPIGRVVSNANNELEPGTFKTFGPKMFSQRKGFGDEATNSRCWDWEANGLYPRPGIPTYLQDKFWAQAQQIRNMCLMYRMRNYDPDIKFDETMVDGRLPGRFKELILGALAVLPDIRDELNEMANKKLEQTIMDWSSRIEAKVLYGMIRCYYRPSPEQNVGAGAIRLACKYVADEANRIVDIENALGFSDPEDDPKNKKKLSGRGVGHIVRTKFQLGTAKGTVGTKPFVVVWDDERIESLCIRYGLEKELGALRNDAPDPFDRQD